MTIFTIIPWLSKCLHTHPAISSSGQPGEVSLSPKLQIRKTRSRDAEDLIPAHTVCGQQSQGRVLVAQLCSTLCNPIDGSPPGSSVPGILQARILEWAAISFSRGSSQARGWTWVSCIGRQILYHLSHSRASTRSSLSACPATSEMLSNQYRPGLIDDRQDCPVHGLCWLLTTLGHPVERPSEKGSSAHAPLIKLCVLVQGHIYLESSLSLFLKKFIWSLVGELMAGIVFS